MKNFRHTIRVMAVASFEDVAVERPSAASAPTAFRIWKAGDNQTDYGVHRFTEASAKILLADQATRGNLYSIDCDHLSLNDKSPPESRKAVGFHKLAVRETKAGPELWATNVEWTSAVRSGLEQDPPEWRYFSPAYDVDKKTSEIVAYLNTALTNNPATWSVTALATQTATRSITMKMTAAEMLAALTGDDEEKKKEAMAALKVAFPEVEGEVVDEKKPKVEKELTTTASEEKPKADDAPKKDEEKEAAIAANSKLAATVTELSRQVASMTAKSLDAERTAILASRTDLPKELVPTLREMPLDLMKKTIAGIPVAVPDPAAAAKVAATRGSHDGTEEIRAARLPPAEHDDLMERMGLSRTTAKVHWDPNRKNNRVFPQIDKTEARRMLAARKEAAPPPRPLLAPTNKEIGR